MCLEDVRLGRQEGSAADSFSCPNATNTQLCGQDPLRTCIILSVSGATPASACPSPLNSVMDAGFYLSRDTPAVMLTVQEHGLVVTQPWFATGLGGTSEVMLITSRLEKT